MTAKLPNYLEVDGGDISYDADTDYPSQLGMAWCYSGNKGTGGSPGSPGSVITGNLQQAVTGSQTAQTVTVGGLSGALQNGMEIYVDNDRVLIQSNTTSPTVTVTGVFPSNHAIYATFYAVPLYWYNVSMDLGAAEVL